ncbi:3-oxoacyl-[acyl-carrier-protein] synthase III C-terminal domain-containing protein [Mycolicibacterium sp. HK-90]|uniref:3-oxoacyl-[acyl-carrier-protein] synthase III C-terminal domain-containing protein n=1 Tax=Mycolicibacterium sp. HK-90 TaxID=3056937 RepID=UPI00265ABD80|nr:3-oxoacyl-[acyl-carrier-protein] synthase III C-terminal domain-containing protein [Mycolicibacterium sp. HK-90]WKG03106.1 3-oxoacyl-[acyl-carrier-protein] synthase III C-terminal domain-containing protein [Mycolicibacterium sp. HK-90]
MPFLDTVSVYVPAGTDNQGRPQHLATDASEMQSVHEMVDCAARQIDASALSAAADSMAASFHCGTLYQGEHFWPITNSLQQSILGRTSAGSATEIRQFCSGGLYGVMLADAVLQAGWAGDYAMVTGGDAIFYFDRHEYAASPATEGSLLGDSGFCALLNRNEGFARIVSAAARSHNPSAGMMHGSAGSGIDDPRFPTLADWIARWENYDLRGPGTVKDNAIASFRVAVRTVTECYERAGVRPDDIDWFAPSFIEPSYVTDMLAKQTFLQPTDGLYSFAAQFGHLTVSDFGVNLAYLMNNKIAKVGDLVLLFAAGNFVNSAAVLLRIEKEVTLPFNVPA